MGRPQPAGDPLAGAPSTSPIAIEPLPYGFQQRVAGERLSAEAKPVPGGHLAALSQPEAVTRALLQDEQPTKTIRRPGA